MAIPSLKSHVPEAAAKRRLATSSGSPVGSARCGYERALRPGETRFSPAGNPIFSRGDR
jgi:hypothetical protein